MTIWHWIRHGPTHEKTFVGWRDVPADLSDTARLERLRAHLPDRGLLVSSDLIRSQATANRIERETHIRLPDDPHLREINFGHWDGLPFETISDRDPDLSRAFWERPGDIRAPGGESWNDAARRVSLAIDRIRFRHPDATVIAVAHFGVILMAVQHALKVPATDVLSHKIDNLSVTRIEMCGHTSAPPRINHLP